MGRYVIPFAGLVAILVGALVVGPVKILRELQVLASPVRWHMRITRGVSVPMRDQVKLDAEVITPLGEGPWPTLLIRTPYRENNWDFAKYFTRHGYVVVNQHTRGRHRSEGTFTASRPDGDDGYDTLSWITRQPWSNGLVGTWGCSHRGESQIFLAALNHPAHKAALPSGAGGAIGRANNSYGYFGIYENGVLALSSALGWFATSGYKDEASASDVSENNVAARIHELPVIDLAARVAPHQTDYVDFVSHKPGDPWWDSYGFITDDDRFSVPTLHVNSWYDQTVRDTFELADFMRSNPAGGVSPPQHVLIGPGNHCDFDKDRTSVGELPISATNIDWWDYYRTWFDAWLKGASLKLPRYRLFVLGANEWQDFEQWPPAAARTQSMFLSAGDGEHRALVSSAVEVVDGHDTYRYDPLNPVPSLGGAVCCTGRKTDSGSFDQRPLASRQDVLVYTSAPLEQPLRVVGNNQVILYVASDAPDTDFTAKLVDVWPDGRAFNIQDSIVRARFRNGLTTAAPPLEPGEVVRLLIKLGPIAYEFQVGHQIALHLSSSNFPRLARNLNTMDDPYSSTESRPALNSVFYDLAQPSQLLLQTVKPSSQN